MQTDICSKAQLVTNLHLYSHSIISGQIYLLWCMKFEHTVCEITFCYDSEEESRTVPSLEDCLLIVL